MGQLGFFDAEKRLAALSEKGDPLEAIAALVPWELGMAADRLRRRGIPAQALLAIAALLSVAAQFALILSWPLPTYLSWSIVAAVGAATVLSFAALAEHFPKESIGQANGALDVLLDAAGFYIRSTSSGSRHGRRPGGA